MEYTQLFANKRSIVVVIIIIAIFFDGSCRARGLKPSGLCAKNKNKSNGAKSQNTRVDARRISRDR